MAGMNYREVASDHLIDTTARPFVSHSWHRNRGVKSMTFASGPSALAPGDAEWLGQSQQRSSTNSTGASQPIRQGVRRDHLIVNAGERPDEWAAKLQWSS